MEYELYHHGILGMKWGIRRYQNKDGSLTAEGRKRYGTVQTLEIRRDVNHFSKEIRKRNRSITLNQEARHQKNASELRDRIAENIFKLKNDEIGPSFEEFKKAAEEADERFNQLLEESKDPKKLEEFDSWQKELDQQYGYEYIPRNSDDLFYHLVSTDPKYKELREKHLQADMKLFNSIKNSVDKTLGSTGSEYVDHWFGPGTKSSTVTLFVESYLNKKVPKNHFIIY